MSELKKRIRELNDTGLVRVMAMPTGSQLQHFAHDEYASRKNKHVLDWAKYAIGRVSATGIPIGFEDVDVAQEILLALPRIARTFDPSGGTSFEVYLRTSTRHMVVSWLRKPLLRIDNVVVEQKQAPQSEEFEAFAVTQADLEIVKVDHTPEALNQLAKTVKASRRFKNLKSEFAARYRNHIAGQRRARLGPRARGTKNAVYELPRIRGASGIDGLRIFVTLGRAKGSGQYEVVLEIHLGRRKEWPDANLTSGIFKVEVCDGKQIAIFQTRFEQESDKLVSIRRFVNLGNPKRD